VSYAGNLRGSLGPLASGPEARAKYPAAGKQTLVEQLVAPVAQPRVADQHDQLDETTLHTAASRGVATPASPLPFSDTLQRVFGRHDISSIQAHTGPEAAASAQTMGAEAYATGDHVVLGHGADLHTVAHEAAHVVQQRGGVQLKGSVGAVGDAYERHADAVADRVIAGQSAEDLLDRGAASVAPRATPAVQRKEGKDDARILENQAGLQGTDVEIPALEGALLATRKEAVELGLLSKASFDAGLALSQAMTQLRPAVAARGAVDPGLQERAAVAAQQLFVALQRETASDKNFQIVPSMTPDSGVTSQNPYTEEVKVTSTFLFWSSTHDVGSWLQELPGFIRQGKWDEAFRGYRRMLDGLDLWVADQLRKQGKGTPEEALGNAQQHHAQLRTGLEQIADKHATRLPALFHPDPGTIEKEKAAGRPAADAIPMNVYFWKDAADGKFHLYDLTTPSQPHGQIIDGEPTAAMMNTFFEEIARYPEGEVRYTLPGGAAGVAPTTGKIKWYEWVAYAGLAIAAVGLALVTAGASIPATVCFAAGAVAGGISAGGHLADTARLGTATTATVVLDVAQIVASFASFGAMSITVKAGSATAALAGSRWFVPLVSTAAGADVSQLAAFTDITFTELNKIQNGAGSAEDKQRAMAVLLTQFVVTGGLTVLSVQGARNVRALAGKPLELIDQNGVKLLRVAGESTPEPGPHPESSTTSSEHGPPTGGSPNVAHDASAEVGNTTSPHGAEHGGTTHPPASASHAERWLTSLEGSLGPEENAKLAKMKAGKTAQQMHDMFGGDLDAARERVRAAVRLDQERAAVAAQSKARVADLRKQIADRGLMDDPDIRPIVEGTTPENWAERIPMLRDKLVAKILRTEAEHAHPGTDVIDGVKIYEKLPEANTDEWIAKNPGKNPGGLTQRADGLYIQRGEIDMMVVDRQSSGQAKVIAREEIKTGGRDTDADARRQLHDQTSLLRDAVAGKKVIRLEVGDRDITAEIDLASDATASKSTRGPAGKGFDKSLGVTAGDLEALCKDLLARSAAAGKGTP
jgi:hypothetical protein